MGKAARSKGRRGEAQAIALLMDRDWVVADLTAGKAGEDLLATDPDGRLWAVEVKMTKAITTLHRQQAMQQARARRAAWMLLSHIDGTSSWLVQRQRHSPIVWSNKNNGDDEK
jgi:Holliday junction resolvase-like predicted endonuclease